MPGLSSAPTRGGRPRAPSGAEADEPARPRESRARTRRVMHGSGRLEIGSEGRRWRYVRPRRPGRARHAGLIAPGALAALPTRCARANANPSTLVGWQ